MCTRLANAPQSHSTALRAHSLWWFKSHSKFSCQHDAGSGNADVLRLNCSEPYWLKTSTSAYIITAAAAAKALALLTPLRWEIDIQLGVHSSQLRLFGVRYGHVVHQHLLPSLRREIDSEQGRSRATQRRAGSRT